MQNWYNVPTYYDVSFSHEMSEEVAFLKSVFNRYCKGAHPKLLEPACGTGRLMMPLLRAGFDCTGFDLNEHALAYLKKKLNRNRLEANIFHGDMANFQIKGQIKGKKFDGGYCTVDTFRHLLSEKEAEQHLINVSAALKKNGIYILGLHLLSEKETTDKVTRWTAKRGRLTVKSSMTMLKLDAKKRTETLKVILRINKTGDRLKSVPEKRYESVYQLRTYTLKQFHKLLLATKVFEIVKAYDHYYDLSRPLKLTEMTDYAVFVLRKI